MTMLAFAPGARAQDDLGDRLLAYARAWDCEASVDLLRLLAVEALGRDPAAFEAALAALAASEGAALDAERGWLVLGPPACEPSAGFEVSGASAWIEEGLVTAPDCRAPLASLAEIAAAQGLGPDAFAAAASDLVASGLLRQEGADLTHALACEAPAPPADPVERVRAAEDAGFRGLLALHLMGPQGDCRVRPADRAAVVEAVADAALPQLGLAPPVAPEALDALRARIEEVLDNPGPAYEIDGATGDLVMVHCSP